MAGRGRLDQGQIRPAQGGLDHRQLERPFGLGGRDSPVPPWNVASILISPLPPGWCRAGPCHEECDDGGSSIGWAGAASHGFKLRSIRWGSSPMTLPGLS